MTTLDLLPDPNTVAKCSDFTMGLGVDPVGTAIAADLLIAVTVPLPWPKPVWEHRLVADIPALVHNAPQLTKVLASVPEPGATDATIVAYHRTSGRRVVHRTSYETLIETVAHVVAGSPSAAATVVVDEAMAESAREIWVCTQGSHDMCCGSYGTRYAERVASEWTDVKVRRVSHTGGHRFAPTGMSLPDGRMWAFLTPEMTTEIFGGQADDASPDTIAACRGWWGAAMGPEQVAERAGLAIVGWSWDSFDRTTEIVGVADLVTTVLVRGASPSELLAFEADVRVAREVPTLACRALGGLPAKPGREYEIADLRVL